MAFETKLVDGVVSVFRFRPSVHPCRRSRSAGQVNQASRVILRIAVRCIPATASRKPNPRSLSYGSSRCDFERAARALRTFASLTFPARAKRSAGNGNGPLSRPRSASIDRDVFRPFRRAIRQLHAEGSPSLLLRSAATAVVNLNGIFQGPARLLVRHPTRVPERQV